MRSDLAALIPPLVIAAAFIAGVVALLRREMAPRRGRARPGQAKSPPGGHSEMKPGQMLGQIPYETQNTDDDGSADNSANGDVVVSGGTDPSERAQGRSLGPVHEDGPPARHSG
jgi:hypothetical protein